MGGEVVGSVQPAGLDVVTPVVREPGHGAELGMQHRKLQEVADARPRARIKVLQALSQ